MKTSALLLVFCFFMTLPSFSQHALNAINIGAVDYVEIPDDPNGSLDIGIGFTIEAWILTGSAQFNQKVAGKIAGDFKNGFILGIQDGQVNMEVFDNVGNQVVLQTGIVPDTTWTHIAGTYEVGEMLKIYVNGQFAGETAASSIIHDFNTNPFRIGIAPWDINALGFFGYIDEIRYWNAVLDETTIRDWMHQDLEGMHPNFANLSVYHKYDEGMGDTTTDHSNSGNDGTLHGALWLPSTVPFKGTYDLFNNEVRGVWLGQNEASSDILTLNGSDITGDQSIVFANSGDGYGFFDDAPTGYDKSLATAWRVTTQGMIPPSATAMFDLSPIDLTNVSDIALLLNDELNFENAVAVPGEIDGNMLSVPAEFFVDGFYLTLGFSEEGVSTQNVHTGKFSFSITPNPNNGQFQLSIKETESAELQIKLMAMSGAALFEKSIALLPDGYTETFDFSELPKGIYLLQLSDQQGVNTQKLSIH